MTLDEAIVDVYRAAAKRAAAAGEPTPPTPSVVPGTGRSCQPNRFVPSKRIRALHRYRGGKLSLKVFARMVAAGHYDRPMAPVDVRAAERWLAGKSA